MILGIGVDTVDVARFEQQLTRTPRLKERLFTESESGFSSASLAARFAAKEALIKALGGSGALGWHDLEIVRGESRAPSFLRTAALERELLLRGDGTVFVSLTHDGGIATAFVVIDGVERRQGER